MCSWPFSSPHIITDPPILNIFQSSVIAKEGDRLDLQCSFTKHTNDPNPFPNITWTNPSDRTSGGSQTTQGLTLTSTYTRRSARRRDSGVYTCSVNNYCPAVGELSDEFNVTIYCELCGYFCIAIIVCTHLCCCINHLCSFVLWLSYPDFIYLVAWITRTPISRDSHLSLVVKTKNRQ